MKRILLFFIFFIGCSQDSEEKKIQVDYILRKKDTVFCPLYKPKFQKREPYPWEEGKAENLCRITKEFFRCKGSSLNPPILRGNEEFIDCDGNHGFSMVEGKEGVYAVLIDILNYIQQKTKKKVVITCGHRCPQHNNYSEYSSLARVSKHMIGAEVDFYVEGMQKNPLEVIDIIFSFYKERRKNFQEFFRYQKNTNVSTQPWYNKEIFVKLFLEKEGRDFDNNHGYPYISIAVRYDIDTKQEVVYSWKKAREYLR